MTGKKEAKTKYDVTPEGIEKRKAKSKIDTEEVLEALEALAPLGWLLLVFGCIGTTLLYVILAL